MSWRAPSCCCCCCDCCCGWPPFSHLDALKRQTFSLRHQLQPQLVVRQSLQLIVCGSVGMGRQLVVCLGSPVAIDANCLQVAPVEPKYSRRVALALEEGHFAVEEVRVGLTGSHCQIDDRMVCRAVVRAECCSIHWSANRSIARWDKTTRPEGAPRKAGGTRLTSTWLNLNASLPIHQLRQGTAQSEGGERCRGLLGPVEDTPVAVLLGQPRQAFDVEVNLFRRRRGFGGRVWSEGRRFHLLAGPLNVGPLSRAGARFAGRMSNGYQISFHKDFPSSL